MRSEQTKIPWENGCIIRCCKDCVPPKRHIGCHSTCKEYKHEKTENNKKRKKEFEGRAKLGRPMGKHDFDMLH